MNRYLLGRRSVGLAEVEREIGYARAVIAALVARAGGYVEITHAEIGAAMPSASLWMERGEDGVTISRR